MAEIAKPIAQAKAAEREFERLSLNQRIQHWVLIASFLLLVITGLPVRYWQSDLSSIMIWGMGGIGARYILHRIGAALLIGICVYHIGWTLLSRHGRREFVELFFQPQDLFDIIQMAKFYFHLSDKRPRFGRFSYLEKFEYYAMGWGSLVMIVTGFMLWFPALTLNDLPKWSLDVARIVHSWEGLLAFLAILISHMYTVHLSPESFPMSKVWLTGKISEKEMAHNHPLEYEKITADSKDQV